MKTWLLIILLLPSIAQARFLMHYGLNYSSDSESGDTEVDSSKIFHKAFIGASVNGAKTLFFGWNINSWSSKLESGATTSEYSMMEMGLRVQYFFSDSYNWYATAEWNPYARGDRAEDEVSGNSTSFGIGYRFKLNRLMGLGAGIHYHSLNIKESKIGSTVNDVSDKRSSLMPMLEFTIMTR